MLEEIMESAKEQRMETIDALLAGYSSLSVEKLLKPLSPDFQHRVLPESLGMPARNRASFAGHAAEIFNIFETFKMMPKAVFDDPELSTVIIEALMLGTLKDGGHEWRNECNMTIKLTEDGTQVLDIREFVDSVKAVEMARRHAPEHFGVANGNVRDDRDDHDDRNVARYRKDGTGHRKDGTGHRKSGGWFNWQPMAASSLACVSLAVFILVSMRPLFAKAQ